MFGITKYCVPRKIVITIIHSLNIVTMWRVNVGIYYFLISIRRLVCAHIINFLNLFVHNYMYNYKMTYTFIILFIKPGPIIVRGIRIFVRLAFNHQGLEVVALTYQLLNIHLLKICTINSTKNKKYSFILIKLNLLEKKKLNVILQFCKHFGLVDVRDCLDWLNYKK